MNDEDKEKIIDVYCTRCDDFIRSTNDPEDVYIDEICWDCSEKQDLEEEWMPDVILIDFNLLERNEGNGD